MAVKPLIESSPGPATDIWNDSLANYYHRGCKVYWETLDTVARYQARCITGSSAVQPVDYLVDLLRSHVGRTGLRGLSLGCNEEHAFEMQFMESGLFEAIEVIDICRPLLERQCRSARSRGLDRIRYRAADLNRIALDPAAYHFIWSVGTVHHIGNLAHLFRQVERALRPGGLFVLREYVGPNRLQFGCGRMALVNAFLAVLPRRYRRTPWGTVKHRQQVIAEHDLADPSEAIASASIRHELCRVFRRCEVIPTGGTLLFPLLQDIAHCFESPQDPAGDRLLRLLITVEHVLVRLRLVPSDFVFCLARKNDSISSTGSDEYDSRPAVGFHHR